MHVIGTAGHVDHGKSSLVERLTGIDPDRFAEEKARGLTIDLGFAWLELPSGNEVGIVDVPGHERFIKNMLAGAGGITVCLFVVAANEGWMPQSSEHLAIVDILGVEQAVIALTKADTVEAEALSATESDVRERVTGTVLEDAPIVACSVVSGDGIDTLVAALDRAVAAATPAPDAGRPRLWVDRVFTIAGAGTVVTGTLSGGSLSVGDSIEIAPEGRRARIRSLQSHKKELQTIVPGHRTAVNLAGLERQGAERGDAIVRAGQFRSTRRIDVQLRATAIEQTRASGITEEGAHLLYVGSAEVPVRVRLLGTERIAAGETGYAQLTLQDPLPLQRGDKFVLRDAGRVVMLGGGIVLDPLADIARRKDAGRRPFLERLAGASAEDALDAHLERAGRLDRDEAGFRTGADVSGAVGLGSMLVSKDEMERLSVALETALRSHHVTKPLEAGMDKEAARNALGIDGGAFDDLVAATEDVIEEGRLVRLATHQVSLAPEQRAERDGLFERIEEGGFTPPLTKELGADPALLRSLAEAGELVRIGDFHLTSTQARRARAEVRSRIEAGGPVTVAQIRDLLGTTRKYAVPLCEWLDSTGATRRQGDLRVLGPNP